MEKVLPIAERINKYKEVNKYLFPSTNVNPKLKLTPTYGRQMCEAIFSNYLGDKCAVPFGMLWFYDSVRQYSNGQQDPNQYFEQLGITNNSLTTVANVANDVLDNASTTKDTKKKGYDNLNKRILSPAPRIKQAIHGSFDEYDFNVLAETIDPDSQYEQSVKESEAYAIGKHLDAFNYFRQQAGMPTESDSVYPRDIDELNLMRSLGEFKSPIAKAIQKACKHTYDISDWEDIKSKLIDDIIDFNRCAIKEYWDEEEKKYKVRYVDVTRLIAQYSDHRDYKESCFYGELKEHSIAEIRYKLEAEGYSEEQIKNAAYLWSGMWGGIMNPSFDQWPNFNKTDQYNNWLYNYYKCYVLEVEWLENDIFYNAENTSNGRRKIFDLEWGKNIDGYRNKTVNTTIKRKYEAKWIIGTDLIYDLKISPSQPRNKDNRRPMFSYHIFSGTEMPITQLLMPVYDEIQLADLKFRNKLQELHNEILMVDLSVLDRMVKPGDVNGMLEILKQMKRLGYLPYRSLGMHGKYQGGAVKPLDKIPSSMMEVIQESIALLESAFKKIELYTGINAAALGGQPQPDQGKGTTEMALQNTSKILKPIINHVFKIKEDSAEFLAEGIRLAIRNDKQAYDSYSKVIGINDTEALKQSEYEARELGIKLIPKPTTQEIESLYRDIEAASMPGKDGKPLIGFDVKLYVKEKLMHGADLTDIRLYVSNAIKKEKERQEMLAQQNIKLQGQQNQQMEQAKSQGEIMKQREKFALEKQNDNNRHDNDKDLESMKQHHERYIKDQDMQMQQNQLNSNQNAGQQYTTNSPTVAE